MGYNWNETSSGSFRRNIRDIRHRSRNHYRMTGEKEPVEAIRRNLELYVRKHVQAALQHF